jgi:hypothetical protein
MNREKLTGAMEEIFLRDTRLMRGIRTSGDKIKVQTVGLQLIHSFLQKTAKNLIILAHF